MIIQHDNEELKTEAQEKWQKPGELTAREAVRSEKKSSREMSTNRGTRTED